MSGRLLLAAALAGSALLAAAWHAGAAVPPRCALHEPRSVVPAGAQHALVRPAATRLLLCRYRGLNPGSTALRLRSSRLLTDRPVIASIASMLNALPRERTGIHCPMDDGSAIIATFSYPRGDERVVRIGLSGCLTVTGASPPVRTAITPGGARLIATLERLAP